MGGFPWITAGEVLLNSEQLLVFRVTSDQDLLDTSSPVSAEVDFEHADTIFQIWGLLLLFLSLRKKVRGGENRKLPRGEENVMLKVDFSVRIGLTSWPLCL